MAALSLCVISPSARVPIILISLLTMAICSVSVDKGKGESCCFRFDFNFVPLHCENVVMTGSATRSTIASTPCVSSSCMASVRRDMAAEACCRRMIQQKSLLLTRKHNC